MPSSLLLASCCRRLPVRGSGGGGKRAVVVIAAGNAVESMRTPARRGKHFVRSAAAPRGDGQQEFLLSPPARPAAT
jgi:hypothetical protein